MENKIIRLMLNRKFWTENGDSLDKNIFSKELLPLINTIETAFSEYPEMQSLAMDELLALYARDNVLTTAKEKDFKLLVRGIYDEDAANESLAKDILRSMRIKEVARKATEVSIEIFNGEHENFDRILEIINSASSVIEHSSMEALTTDMSELLELASPKNLYGFNLGVLNDAVKGVGKQHLLIIFGRPEVGKSSFTAFTVGGFMVNGLGVDYFANEEPGYKIQLNIVRSIMGMSDDELRAAKEFPAWNAVKDKIRLYDAVGMEMEALERHVAGSPSEVIVIDQADKVNVKGNYDSPTEKIKDRYVKLREIAKRNDKLVIAVSQASADAQDKRFPSYDMLENSKTGKAGEADMIIGIGRNSTIDAEDIRHLCVSKNKINGWHGNLTVRFDAARNIFEA